MSTQLKGGIELTSNTAPFATGIGRALDSLRKLDTQTNQSTQRTQQFSQATATIKGPLDSLGMSTSAAAQRLQQYNQRAGEAHSRTQQAAGVLRQSQTAMANFGRAAESAAASTQKMAIQTNNAKGAVGGLAAQTGQASAGMSRMGQTTTQAAQATGRLNAGTIGTAASIGTMGAGLVSLEASMSNYAKAEYKVEKSTLAVQKARDLMQSTTASLMAAQLNYDKAQKAGKKTAEEMAVLEQRLSYYKQKLSTDTEDLQLKQEKLNLANMDYADTQKLMASSIATTLLGTLSAAASMIQAKSIATVKDTVAAGTNTTATKTNALAQLTSSRAFKMLLIDMTAAKTGFSQITQNMKMSTIAAKGLGPSLRGVAGGIKGVVMSLGPVGIIMTLATSLWAAWESSQQFRDGVHWVINEMQKLFEMVSQILVPLQWLDKGLQALGINVGESIDKWQEQTAVIGEADAAMQDAGNTVIELDAYEQDMTATLGELETQTDQTTIATDSMSGAMQGAATAVMQHTSAISADMAAMRAHATSIHENSTAMLNDHIVSFDAAADAILTHDERLRTNLAGLQNWAKNYKDKMTESAENGAQFVAATESEFERLVVSLRQDGHDVDGTLRMMGITSIDTSGIIQESMQGAGQAMHGFAGDAEAAGGRVKNTLKNMHMEIQAFEIALKKNDNFAELTIRNILNAFKTMSTEAKSIYEKAMINNANYLIRMRGGNTSIDSLDDALTVTEQHRTGNWANPTHAEGVGANMQHHGPGERSNKANELLKKGIYVVDPVGDGIWRKSHSDSYKLGSKHHSKTGKPKGIALWNGRDFEVYGPGTPQYRERFGLSGYTTKYTTGGPSSRSVALETSLGYDISEYENEDDDQRQTIEVHAK